jgi:aldehyde dehydrogenase (NAD+)
MSLKITPKKVGLSPLNTGVFSGSESRKASGGILEVRSPIDHAILGKVTLATSGDVEPIVARAHEAFLKWRVVPAPVRGELVRRIGQKVREKKEELAAVVCNEAGKITSEALGEVQEWIDICDFAVGLSRQLHGLTIASERPSHRMMEQWHPMGVVGCITAFNFPMAVWAWNAMLAFVCGDPVIWKPSEKTPLCALAAHQMVTEAARDFEPAKGLALSSLLIGKADVGEALAAHPLIPLVSATGSTRMGIEVAKTVAGRLGRSLLELGGNNAMIVTPTAEIELATRAIVFSAVGTAGQRCTTLRRLICHKSRTKDLVARLKKIYAKLPVGDPRTAGTLVGPLIDEASFNAMQNALAEARKQKGTVYGGERVTTGVPGKGFYVQPAIVEIAAGAPITHHETFAPILYVMSYDKLEVAVDVHNNVPQGLSSAIFTQDVREAELFLSPAGSDCGIANVNIGTSGAEIGGAFGGEKQTGGGRESGSDSWKNYMRRTTNTVNYGTALPLAQGVKFDV